MSHPKDLPALTLGDRYATVEVDGRRAEGRPKFYIDGDQIWIEIMGHAEVALSLTDLQAALAESLTEADEEDE